MYWHWLWWNIDIAVPRRKMRIDDYEYESFFTCEYCIQQKSCEYAFDLYNTDFDCLAEK